MLELKTELVQEMSKAVMAIIAKTDRIYKNTSEKGHIQDDLKELKKELREIGKSWKVGCCIIGSKIHAYYPKLKNKNLITEYRITPYVLLNLRSMKGMKNEVIENLKEKINNEIFENDNKFKTPRKEGEFFQFLENCNLHGLDKKDKDSIIKYSKMALNDMWGYLCDEMEDYQNDILMLIDESDNEKLDTKRYQVIIRRDSILHKKYLLIKEVLDRKITGINSLNLYGIKVKQEFNVQETSKKV